MTNLTHYPGSEAHHAAKCSALRCVRCTSSLRSATPLRHPEGPHIRLRSSFEAPRRPTAGAYIQPLDSDAIQRQNTCMNGTRFVAFWIALIASMLFAISGVLWLADTWYTTTNSRCLLQFPLKWFGCVIGNHENLAGGLIAAAGTILAGVIAWRVVQRQIEADRSLAERQEIATLNLVCSELRPAFDLYATVWRTVDIATTKVGVELLNGVSLAMTFAPLEEFVGQKFGEIRPYIIALHPLKRWQLQHIERYCLSISKYIEANQQPANPNLWLMSVRTRLTYLATAAEEFSSEFSTTFRGRTRQLINETSEAEMHRPLVDQYERFGRLD